MVRGERCPFERVVFVGIAEPVKAGESSLLPFPLTQWVIVERESGARIYIKPDSIRYYEESEAVKRLDSGVKCPRCGYDLSSKAWLGCPECGWRRSEEVA